MKFALAVVISAIFLSLGGLFFLFAPIGRSQTIPTSATSTPNSDFATAVQAGIQALVSNPAVQSEQQQIKSQDYKSTWDEFGTNVLVDGSAPPAEINNQVISDITQSAAVAQNYDQQEADYLQAQQITPEQVQSAEQSTGVDLSPTQQIDVNPSIDANPDVNLSPADVSVPESSVSSLETETSTITTSTPTTEFSTTTSPSESGITSSATTTSTTLSAGLEIAQSIDNATPQTGATINYTLAVSAFGPDTSTEVMATDVLPTGITFVSSTSSVGTYDSSTGVWNVGDMNASSTAMLVITATVDASDTAGQSIVNAATVSESPTEANPNEDNASSSANITIAANDNMIFNSILQGEQSQPATSTEAATTTSPDVTPSDTTPPDATPSPDTTPPDQ